MKIHLLDHFSDYIHKLGNLSNASAELPETAMMDLRDAYRQRNHDEAALVIVRTTAQKEMFQYSELNAHPAKECRDYEIPPTNVPIQWLMKILRPEIKTLDDLAGWCAMPKGELQNHFA